MGAIVVRVVAVAVAVGAAAFVLYANLHPRPPALLPNVFVYDGPANTPTSWEAFDYGWPLTHATVFGEAHDFDKLSRNNFVANALAGVFLIAAPLALGELLLRGRRPAGDASK